MVEMYGYILPMRELIMNNRSLFGAQRRCFLGQITCGGEGSMHAWRLKCSGGENDEKWQEDIEKDRGLYSQKIIVL